MSEVSTVLAASIFIGVLTFLSVSATDSIPELGNVSGTENFQEFDPQNDTIATTDYTVKDSVNISSNGVVSHDGTTNDRGENYGYIRYDVEGINRLNLELDSRLLNSVGIAYYDSNGTLLATQGYPDSPFTFDRDGAESFAGGEIKFLEVRLDGDNRLISIEVVPEGTGVIAKANNLIGVFTNLSSNTVWFNLIVGIPLAIAGLYLLLQILKDVIPLT